LGLQSAIGLFSSPFPSGRTILSARSSTSLKSLENLTMSEVKLNLIDSKQTIHGTVHGSIADRAVAALSAEPETIAELEAAMCRYMKLETGETPFPLFRAAAEIDERPWDAGIVIIDLAARIAASESTYSQPGPEGEVEYHDGDSATDITVAYRLPEDWIFLTSIAEYQGMCQSRRNERHSTPPLDARAVLYGRQFLEFIFHEFSQSISIEQFHQAAEANQLGPPIVGSGTVETQEASIHDEDEIDTGLLKDISAIHARWLMTPRDDLLGKSPREIMFERREFIDYDLQTRELQWSFQGEGPPCLATDSHAYRFAGFGTHEWVIYYDLVRHLLWSAARIRSEESTNEGMKGKSDVDRNIARLEEIKAEWLEQPQPDYDGRIPALLIENERRRLPLALRARDMIVDDDCPMCQMMADETVWGVNVGFWHLDGAHMDDDFAFSWCRTIEEWEAENRRHEEFNREFERERKEREARIARGEKVEDDFNLDWLDTFTQEHSR
jgi:hypothetical protein